jgi:hypothetical protein
VLLTLNLCDYAEVVPTRKCWRVIRFQTLRVTQPDERALAEILFHVSRRAKLSRRTLKLLTRRISSVLLVALEGSQVPCEGRIPFFTECPSLPARPELLTVGGFPPATAARPQHAELRKHF